MNWLTIAVIVFILVLVLAGLKLGFIRMLVSLVALLVTVVLAGFLREPIHDLLLERTGLYETVETGVEDFTQKTLAPASDITSKSTEDILAGLPLPELLRDKLAEGLAQSVGQKVDVSGFQKSLASQLSKLVFSSIVYVISFLGSWILVSIISFLLIHAAKLPGIRQVNSLAGAALGFAMALLLIWMGSLLVTSFGSTDWGQEALRLIEESPVLAFIYNHNPFLGSVFGKQAV